MRNAAEGGGGYLSLGLSFVDVAGGVKLDAAAIWRRGEEERGWGGVSATDVVVGAVGAFYAEAAAFVE